MEKLIQDLLSQNTTLVSKERFDTILRNQQVINEISGDIIECGVWAGGMSIFLTKLFETKNIWMADSFEGFQPLDTAKYQYDRETHTPSYNPMIKVTQETVENNFKKFDIDINQKRIKFLPGFVKDTLPKSKIKKIALLRIDVDAYSATREILDCLYDKVSVGGFIVFDDTCLQPTTDAIFDFFEDRKIEIELRHPETDESFACKRGAILPCGCYMIKK
jgi:O-methyltransferase